MYWYWIFNYWNLNQREVVTNLKRVMAGRESEGMVREGRSISYLMLAPVEP